MEHLNNCDTIRLYGLILCSIVYPSIYEYVTEEKDSMPKNELKPSNFFNPDTQLATLCLIACPGAEDLAAKEKAAQKTA